MRDVWQKVIRSLLKVEYHVPYVVLRARVQERGSLLNCICRARHHAGLSIAVVRRCARIVACRIDVLRRRIVDVNGWRGRLGSSFRLRARTR